MIRNLTRNNRFFSTTVTDELNNSFGSLDDAVDRFEAPALEYKKPVASIQVTSLLNNLSVYSNRSTMFGNEVLIDVSFSVQSEIEISSLTPVLRIQTDVGSFVCQLLYTENDTSVITPAYITDSLIAITLPDESNRLKPGIEYNVIALTII